MSDTVEILVQDLIGRVENYTLPISKPLQPVFEAITNSIHAIDSLKENNKDVIGEIVISVIRENGNSVLSEKYLSGSIVGFNIRDNGIGLNEANFTSFKTLDSRYNQKKGCKGVGRLTYLKCFEKNSIQSCYQQNTNVYKIRNVVLNFDGINSSIEPCEQHNSYTILTLQNIKPEYEKHLSKNVIDISKNILDHFLPYFAINSMPIVKIQDGENIIDLQKMFNQYYDVQHQDIEIDVKEKKSIFRLTHIKMYLDKPNKQDQHKVVYCGNNREVTAKILDYNYKDKNQYVVGLSKNISDRNNKLFAYRCYVSSDYLNDNLSQDKTIFHIPDNDDNLDQISLKNLTLLLAKYFKQYLEPDLQTELKNGKQRIEDYVNNNAPEYKSLLENNNLYVSMNDSEDDKDNLLLHTMQQKRRLLKENAEKYVHTDDKLQRDEYFDEYMKTLNEVAPINLTRYVIDRSYSIKLLKNYIQTNDFEKAPHELIMPKIQNYGSNNLWMIDEKLAFHRYLTSNKKCFKDNDKRPDIIAIVSESDKLGDSLTIVEFKKPGNAAKIEDLHQLKEYLYLARNQKAEYETSENIKGKRFITHDNIKTMPAFCYLIVDIISDDIKRECKSYQFVENGNFLMGYWAGEYNAYVQIMTYERMIQDSEKRNRIFEHQLRNM